MSSNHSLDVKLAERSFLASQRKAGEAKKKGRPKGTTKEDLIRKALKDNTTNFFKKILDDDTEEKLWFIFLSGRIQDKDTDGNPILDKNGNYTYLELSGVSWNAFKQMVAYKRGQPSIRVESDKGDGTVTVNFNVMGASAGDMAKKVRELGLLPVSSTSEV